MIVSSEAVYYDGSIHELDRILQEDKLAIQVDSDGDGTAEEEKTVYLSAVRREEGLPAWIWFAVGLVVGLIVSFVAWRRMIGKQETRS